MTKLTSRRPDPARRIDNMMIRSWDMTRKTQPATVDVILEREEKLLMIRRGNVPFKGHLALPGGFVDFGETVEAALIREAEEELHLQVVPIAILGVYSGPDRDPRGPVISTVFVAEFDGEPVAGDDAATVEWVSIDRVSEKELAFDHQQIVEDYLRWKVNRATGWSTKSTRRSLQE